MPLVLQLVLIPSSSGQFFKFPGAPIAGIPYQQSKLVSWVTVVKCRECGQVMCDNCAFLKKSIALEVFEFV